MKPICPGWKLESPKFKDYCHELAFGAAKPEQIVPLGRSIEGVPLVYQGEKPACVSCAVTWIKEWMETMNELSVLCWQFLYNQSLTGPSGVVPSKVLDVARKTGIATDVEGNDAEMHKIPNYFFLRDLSGYSIYNALKMSPIMVGVADWKGVGPHMMVAYDVKDDQTLKGVSWWDKNKQELVEIPFSQVIFACRIDNLPGVFVPSDIQLFTIQTLIAKLAFFIKKLVCST